MEQNNNPILTDSFNREHKYLRISLTEKCNLRCTYCMPSNGVLLTPKSHLMTNDEVVDIAKVFVTHGVTKIRLTGGEPLVRKDVGAVLKRLGELPVTLAITTNALLVDRFLATFKYVGINTVNVSLDTLDEEKFAQITLRNQYKKTLQNIQLLLTEGFNVKLNVVLMKGINDDEIEDFISLTKEWPVSVRFIEFMPFNGNKWEVSKMVSYNEIMEKVRTCFTNEHILRLQDAENDTAKNYKIKGYLGSFAVISSVTNPFCDTCDRMRLTADGKIKNCLFSSQESDLLSVLRSNGDIAEIIAKSIRSKKKVRGGMNTLATFKDTSLHKNRSMITIGG